MQHGKLACIYIFICTYTFLFISTFPTQVDVSGKESLLQTARSTLNSKIINRHRDHMADICVSAVLAVCITPLPQFTSINTHSHRWPTLSART